jgi:ribosome-associated protein
MSIHCTEPTKQLSLKNSNGATKMRTVEITEKTVALYKILKFEGVVSSGGQAKAVIDDGQVTVNGEVETQRRKKISTGDRIEFAGETLEILFKPQ